MNKAAFWVSTALFGTLIAEAAAHGFDGSGGPVIEFPDTAQALWNQNKNDAGSSINSQNYTTGYTSYSDHAADDFVIPVGETWTITEVDVTGAYYSGSGPAISENVIFYRNSRGTPGKPVTNGTFNNLDGGNGPNFSIGLPSGGLKLTSGHYWVSVVATEEFVNGGLWGWEVNNRQRKKQAMWENPGGGYASCYTWGTIENCVGYGPDLMFELRGTVSAGG